MKFNYITPMLQISMISEEDLIRTSIGIPDRAHFGAGEQGAAEMLEDFILS